MHRKKVLVIASHYPPNQRVGGVIRIAKIVKYLSIDLWEPIIVTTNMAKDEIENDDLFREVGDIGQVYRLPQLDLRTLFHGMKQMRQVLYRLVNPRASRKKNDAGQMSGLAAGQGLRPPLSSLFLVPDHLVLWALLASAWSVFIGWTKDIDVVYATSPLQSGLLVGYVVKKICKIPLIVEMRDPWTTNPFFIKRAFRILDYLEEVIEHQVLLSADRIVVINIYFIDPIIKKYPDLSREKFSIIPNGFDEDDFNEIIPMTNKKLTIVHAGQFYLGRSGLPFLQAFSKVVAKHSWAMEKWQVRLVGSGEEYRNAINDLGIAESVEIVGTVPHSLALRHIVSGDILLLIPGEGFSTLTGKVFEYMAAKRPILALAEDGAAARLISRLGIGWVIPPDNIDAIAESLSLFMERIQSRSFHYPIENEEYVKYKRKNIAHQCAIVMDNVSSNLEPTSR